MRERVRFLGGFFWGVFGGESGRISLNALVFDGFFWGVENIGIFCVFHEKMAFLRPRKFFS